MDALRPIGDRKDDEFLFYETFDCRTRSDGVDLNYMVQRAV